MSQSTDSKVFDRASRNGLTSAALLVVAGKAWQRQVKHRAVTCGVILYRNFPETVLLLELRLTLPAPLPATCILIGQLKLDISPSKPRNYRCVKTHVDPCI
jgi:hypothetical protein